MAVTYLLNTHGIAFMLQVHLYQGQVNRSAGTQCTLNATIVFKHATILRDGIKSFGARKYVILDTVRWFSGARNIATVKRYDLSLFFAVNHLTNSLTHSLTH
jgi:hypothetical protein